MIQAIELIKYIERVPVEIRTKKFLFKGIYYNQSNLDGIIYIIF